jgi:hypothetical protein
MVYHVWNHVLTDFVHRYFLQFILLVSGTGSILVSHLLPWSRQVKLFSVSGLFVRLHGRPRQATGVLQPASLLYRPPWTFQLWPPYARAPTDAFRTLAAEVGTYGRGIGPVNFA